ncbi:c-type cytochrome [Shimia sagamensis]|uniref:Nitric oxide reductase, NorC subunit apoprotein n=1 Tax=Shimia sagamensis TaxID=1566352 RepID=A0ABY1NDQ9_9RHOB|nr:cytochrome c [Shimia sagamensis]SMP07159.1 nitric oxide reductase, NorC subunit apoprotein [Shimia sagamensis]
MREVMTKTMARNVFYGGSLFFIVVFLILSAHSVRYVVTQSTAHAELTDSVARGKHVWEKHACINCHTLMGEGAYFAPELQNVMARWGVDDDPETAFEIMKAWMESQPTGIEGRRQMPQFNLSDDELRDLTDFFIWVNGIDAQGWPPNEAG